VVLTVDGLDAEPEQGVSLRPIGMCSVEEFHRRGTTISVLFVASPGSELPYAISGAVWPSLTRRRRAGTPEQYATWAADWLLRQMNRPVIREEWLGRDRVVATTWRLNDTGRVLGTTGLTPRRWFRRRADRVVAVR
jgi:hypothetical protein